MDDSLKVHSLQDGMLIKDLSDIGRSSLFTSFCINELILTQYEVYFTCILYIKIILLIYKLN